VTSVERLQAAIEKLEAAQGETWYFTTPGDEGLLSRQGWIDAVNPGGGRQVLGLIGPGDADRILMLHRTIDAQIAVLMAGLDRVERWLSPDSEFGFDPDLDGDGSAAAPEALALADAILGSDS
jgi:hypothetical protein